MKNSKFSLNVIGILSTLLLSTIFFVPVWYFSKTINVDNVSTDTPVESINLLEFDKLTQIKEIYQTNNVNLNTIFYIISLFLIS